MKRKTTPGERIAADFRRIFAWDGFQLDRRIDAAIRRAQAAAYDEGHSAHQDEQEGCIESRPNPYRKARRK